MKSTFSSVSLVVGAILLLTAVPTLPPGGAAPSVSIGSPSDGFLTTVSTVNVSGNASGSGDRWFQTSRSDFYAGAMEGLIETNGTLGLNRNRTVTYDDFDDDQLNPDRWNWTYYPDLPIEETGSELRMNGTSGFCWSEAEITSALEVPNSASVDLKSWSGANFELVFSLEEDSWNSAYFRLYSSSYYYNGSNGTNGSWQNRTRLYYGYSYGGDYSISLPSGALNFKIAVTSNTTYFYLNGAQRGTGYTSMRNMKIRIAARCFDQNGWVDARWDNVKAGDYYSGSGNFTSSVYDTGSVDPVLKAVRWNATVPNGSGLSVQVRSSDSWNMSSATAWAAVGNGQGAGLPAVKRHLQYRVGFTSEEGLAAPSFQDIEIRYDKPVARVEVSIDGNATWLPATGTASWNITLSLPENTNLLRVRVTDVAGDTAVAPLRVEVDTTPPAGGVIIDSGAWYTTDTSVMLALSASDRYGVVSMIVSENPGFTGASWVDFKSTLGLRLSGGDGQKTVYVKYKDSNGWESTVYSSSILLDTQPPQGSVLIDGGARYTRNATVTLTFNATDPTGVSAMMVSNTLDFAGAQWIDYVGEGSALRWGLTAGSGERSVYVKFRDAGGHVSQSCEDSITADLEAPSVALSINGGAPSTNDRNITIALTPAENLNAAMMQVREGDGSFPAGFAWSPFERSVRLVLSGADGPRTVSARLMDAAGNIGQPATAWILLDTTAPVTKLPGFPEISYRAAINISWDATDAGSGVLWCDVQYRTGDGPWTDWLLKTCATAAVFTGEDGKTYSFRARAQDRAGNVEPFPPSVENSVTFSIAKGALTITGPASKATIGGKARIAGQCTPDADGREPVMVLVRVDDGPWQVAEGTSNWSLYLDTRGLSDGTHVIRVKSFDGSQYSPETERAVTVKNAGAAGAFDPVPVLAVGLVLAIVALVAMAFVNRRKPIPVAQPVQ